MELCVIILFCLSLVICILSDSSILIALAFGLCLFWIYGLKKGFTPLNLLKMTFTGINTVKNILITFVLIGIMTALWREAGTIAVIVSTASKLISPPVFLLAAFLLCCFVSFLTGTAFGTAATMGVICSTMAVSLGISPLFTGGAILAGSYFGDRCSPISTSAILVSTLTKSDLFCNLKNMARSAVVPFLPSCVLYGFLGKTFSANGRIPDLTGIFSRGFEMELVCVLPALLILVLSLLKVNVKITMGASILCAVPICILLQGSDAVSLPHLAVFGYTSQDTQIASMMNGGGIVSMLKPMCIVCLSSSYSDIFRKTGLLNGAKSAVNAVSAKTNSYIAALLTSAVTGMIACNQTLSIMLTHQLCSDTEKDNSRLALNIEDSAVVTASLVPWSIASSVALSAVSCPQTSIAFGFFLYLLPLWRVVQSLIFKRKHS